MMKNLQQVVEKEGQPGEKGEVSWDNKSVFGGPTLTWGAQGATTAQPRQLGSTSGQRPRLASCLLPQAARASHQRAAEVRGPQGWLLHPS